MASYLEISYLQVALIAALIVVNAALSVALKLRLEWSLLIASFRTVVQLILIGLVLNWVFAQTQWYWLVLLATLMTVIAGLTAAQRTKRRYPGMWLDSLLAIWISSWVTTAYTLQVILSGESLWLDPQYTIPLLGMVLGNALTGISVGLNTLTDTFASKRAEIDSQLALGATSFEAARPLIQNAVRAGMIPIINSMMVVGLVSLPGMMTGQLLSGVEPMEAVKYQIVIMFLIAAATALSTVGIVLLGYRRLFNQRHQFLAERITTRSRI